MNNLKISHSKQDKNHNEVIYQSDCEINKISFYFENGNNWHFIINTDDTEEVLLDRLNGITELIRKTLNAKNDEVKGEPNPWNNPNDKDCGEYHAEKFAYWNDETKTTWCSKCKVDTGVPF